MRKNTFLCTSNTISATLKKKLAALADLCCDIDLLKFSLATLCAALEEHFAQQVILLIDEYDVPLNAAHLNGYYEEMRDFVRTLLASVLKDNPSLQFAVLTGCLCLAQESIFTAHNNLSCYGINQHKFSDKFGFTENEVDILLHRTHLQNKKQELARWYDGYQFGKTHGIYCPWDVIEYVKAALEDPFACTELYWITTSGNEILREVLQNTDFSLKQKWEKLIRGETVFARIIESLTFDSLLLSEDHIVSLLYLTGYLTRANVPLSGSERDPPDNRLTALCIPNAEIRQVFIEASDFWFSEYMRQSDRKDFFDALWNGDEQAMTLEITRFLQKSISYYDSHADYCHGFISGLFFKSGFEVISNDDLGDGRPDLEIFDDAGPRVAMLAIKHTKDVKTFSGLAEKALKQIANKHYDAPFRERPGISILHWGLAFCKKSCQTLVHKIDLSSSACYK